MAAEADKAGRDELVRTRAHLAALVESTDDFILICDERGLPVLFNRAYAQLMRDALGIEMRPGLQPHTLLPDPEQIAWWEALHGRVLAGEAFRVDYSIPIGGELRHFELAYTPIRDADGISGFTEVARDITARRRAEEALQESEARYRQVTELASDFAYAFHLRDDGEWFCAWVTEAIVRITGFTREEVAARGGWQTLIHPEDRSIVEGQIEQLRCGRRATVEYRMLPKSGEARWVRDSARPEMAQGRLVRVFGAVQDITGARRAAEERRAIELSMQQAQKLESLGLLAGGVAHDFNNLLTAIQGNAALAADAVAAGAPADRFLLRIGEAAERAATLCSQMLAYAGKGRFVVGPVDLSHVVEGLGRMLEVTVPKHVTLRAELARELPPVRGDATQLGQVVMNLITNAAEAIGDEQGTVVLRTGVADYEANALRREHLPEGHPAGRYVHVQVEDDGCGMDDEARLHLFDPFFTSKHDGRGLGLSAVLGIVRAHKGAIAVRSRPGQGTTVTVYLPALAGVTARRPSSAAPPPPSWRGSGTVLLVDDERSVRRVAEQMLANMGFAVVVAGDGAEALELFGARPEAFRAVIVDVAMPHMDGAQCCHELRKIRADVPIVVFSGYARDEVMQRFGGLRISGFLHKPFQPAALRALMEQALGAAGAGSSPRGT